MKNKILIMILATIALAGCTKKNNENSVKTEFIKLTYDSYENSFSSENNDEYVIIDQMNISDIEAGTAGILYIIQFNNTYYMIVGMDDNNYYAISAEQFSVKEDLSYDLITNLIENGTYYEVLGYNSTIAFRNDVNNFMNE